MSSSVLSPAAAGELSPRRKSLVLAICCVSMVVVVMDISIVKVALPRWALQETTAEEVRDLLEASAAS